jgi:hypothetical protein
MASQINSKKWMLFVKQAKGSNVTDMHVAREDRAGHVVLKYNGKARNGRIMTGEWVIDSKVDQKDRPAAEVEAEVREFLEKARKNFFVRREGGLTGDAFKSKQEEEAEKAKPLVSEPEKKA